jgi:hypothetical protein
LDFVKWVIILSVFAFGTAVFCMALYILTPLLIDALTGTSGSCNYPSGEAGGGASGVQASLYSLCSTAKSFLGIGAMIMLVLSSPVLFISNAAASFEIFSAKVPGSPKAVWLGILWLFPGIGGLAYLLSGRKGFRQA